MSDGTGGSLVTKAGDAAVDAVELAGYVHVQARYFLGVTQSGFDGYGPAQSTGTVCPYNESQLVLPKTTEKKKWAGNCTENYD
jgi:hypothetical protein